MSKIVDLEANAMELMRFKGHLMMCPHCTRYYHQFAAIKKALGEVHEELLPEDFEAVMAPVFEALDSDS